MEDLEKKQSGQIYDARNPELENRLAGCAASDAHRANYRTPDMRPIREFLSEWYGESYAELLLKVNPRRILENRPVLYEPSPERRRKRRWFV